MQRLSQAVDRTLVLAQVTRIRSASDWFNPADVGGLFEVFRVPAPADVSNMLMASSKRGLAVRRKESPRWSLTPEGEYRVNELVGNIDFAKLQPLLIRTPSAEFGHAQHPTLAPELAPAKWAAGIASLLKKHPFDSNVLCMTRFPKDGADGALSTSITESRVALEHHGLTLHLASDRIVDDDLLSNVAAYMWACRFGVGIFESRVDGRLNYNLLTEVGAMIMAGRRCALLRDKTVPEMPTDLIGQIYKPVDLDKGVEVSGALHAWAAHDLGLGRCPHCPP